MQSTGHSSIHALSLMSTQGSAIVYVTEVSSISCPVGLPVSGRARPKVAAKYRWRVLKHSSQCPLPPAARGRGAGCLLILDVPQTPRRGPPLPVSFFLLLAAYVTPATSAATL